MQNACPRLPRSGLETLIDEWIFNEIDRHILKRRLLDGITFMELADEVCLSPDQTKKRFYKASKELFEHTQT